MKKIMFIMFLVLITCQVQAAYLLVDGVDLATNSPITLSAGTHYLLLGGTETTNPFPEGLNWGNGIIYLHCSDGAYSDYYTGGAEYTGNYWEKSGVGTATHWVDIVDMPSGLPDEARVRIDDPDEANGTEWYAFEFTYDGTGRIGFDCGYRTEEDGWISLANGKILPVPEPSTLIMMAGSLLFLNRRRLKK